MEGSLMVEYATTPMADERLPAVELRVGDGGLVIVIEGSRWH